MLDTLRASGALKQGHFLLSSGRHSDQYIEKFDLLRQPGATSRACALIAERVSSQAIDVVVGPTTGGVILAFEVARQLGVNAAYAERSGGNETGREFRRGITFAKGARVLVVDDILTTGGSVRETLAALDAHDVDVIGVALLVDRSGGAASVGVPGFSLVSLDIVSWERELCPLCQRGVPLVKPGTTPSKAS
ncbi:MAG: orotate phosphoribosyltransferase [Chloroflexi bacterium]|nr:orotate phosphoribosyltransferase [Chloroflexota bacterium]